ncbi:caspase family protein [Bradyrhizobium sp. CB3481]|uniref:caspase family protein n=1 Tax=Bradyrhizobium sp. CB3481 TaxID=3039158 RepID=UPI0024B0EA50|nr:caspase family protein [Bradyrhizobium sp. CB3481]WFU20407.1 tetratricopeptide repeat protein [Bradyrhizobium sp. CB3481]
MLRALLLALVMLAAAGPARAAGDIDTCRNSTAEPAARLAACESVIADESITGPSRAAAFWYRGDTLMKKRDYDGAIAAFTTSHEIAPQNVMVINARGIAYSYKGDDEHALADYDLCLQLRPTFGSAYNNRGLIFMRRGELQRSLDEFNLAVKYIGNDQSRYLHHYNRGRLQGLMKRYEESLADFAEAQRANPDGPQVPGYRCLTYIGMGRFDDALTDCNTALAKSPNNLYALTNRANAYLGKGNLDAALNDYNQVLKVNPNYVRAYVGRGQLYEKRRNLAAARTDYRAVANAVAAKREDIDTTLARAVAKERLEALLGTAAPASKAPQPAGPRKVALIIGNGAYKNVAPLDNPPRDAKLIASTFRDLGFATVTLSSDLTRDKFFAALHEFGLESEKADWAVVYYAGHGMEIGGVNYLIPVDARLKADSDAETQAVALEQVIASVAGARKLRLVMLDACRDNPFEKTMQRTIALKLVNRGFSNIEPEAGFMVVYAAKHGETALDGDSVNSPFATVLARVIREPKIEVRKLFDIVRDDVWKATNRTQQPFTYGSLPGREDFYFVAEK